MKLLEFKDLIRHIPYEFHSFEVSKSVWIDSPQRELIEDIFRNRKSISLSRAEVLDSNKSIDHKIIKTLMWGYPTKGRGTNIDKILQHKSFRSIKSFLISMKSTGLSLADLEKQIKEIDGLGISTITKLLYFFRISFKHYYCLILDDQIIKLIRTNKYEELLPLQGVSRYNVVNNYYKYLELLNILSRKIDCEPVQIELFLYQFGRNLSKTNDGK